MNATLRPLKTIASLAGLLLLAQPFAAQAEEAGLTLRAAERLAVERNLALQAAQLRREAVAGSVGEALGGIYDPRFRLTAAGGEARDPLNLTPPDLAASRYLRLDLSLLRTLPSGAEVAVGLDNLQRDDLDNPAVGVDPNWRSELRFTLTQPLLKGFGRAATEEAVAVAVKGDEAAVAGIKAQVETLLARVRNSFSDIARARRLVLFRQASLALAETILTETRARVTVGVLPPIDALEAEVGVKQREKELLDAGQGVEAQLDLLAEILALQPPLQVADAPFPEESFTPDEAADVAAALARRPDLEQALKTQERYQVEADAAAKRKLPDLDLTASYAQKGLGGDYGDDLDQTLSHEARNWELGVVFSYPLGNRQAQGESLRRGALAEAARRDVQLQREAIRYQVRSAIRQLEVGRLLRDVTRKGVELAEEKLKNLLKRRDVGLATTRDVLEGETELARARADHSDAQAALEKAGTEYLRATGRLAQHEGIAVEAVRGT